MHSELWVQLVGQAPVAPPQTYGVQAGVPAAPAGKTKQVPLTIPPAPRLQASHAPPVQAVPQHTPSTQKFEAHWLVEVQLLPLGCRGMQAPLWQYAVLAQFASTVQLVGQLWLVPSQTRLLAHAGTPARPATTGAQLVPLAPQAEHASPQLAVQQIDTAAFAAEGTHRLLAQ